MTKKEIIQISKSKPKKISILCTFKAYTFSATPCSILAIYTQCNKTAVYYAKQGS